MLGNGAELFAKLNQQPLRLRDVAERMAQGIRTSANPIYVLDVVSSGPEDRDRLPEQLQREVKLERGAVLPFLQGRDIRPYVLEPSGKVVVMPYRVKTGRAELMAEASCGRSSCWPTAIQRTRTRSCSKNARKGGCAVKNGRASSTRKHIELMSTPKIPSPTSPTSHPSPSTLMARSPHHRLRITPKPDALESPPTCWLAQQPLLTYLK